jgi:hypothetical protein
MDLDSAIQRKVCDYVETHPSRLFTINRSPVRTPPRTSRHGERRGIAGKTRSAAYALKNCTLRSTN